MKGLKLGFNRKYNKKVLALIMSALLLTLTLTLAGCGSTGSKEAEQKPIELRLAHFFPSNHPAEEDLIQPWAKAVEEATNGRVIITSYPNQTLLQADAVYSGVVSGIADIGLSCFSYTRGSFPILEAFELPGVRYNNSKVASAAAWEGIQQLNPKEVQDTKLMMVFTTGPGDLFTKTPVRNLGDLKGMEIRATGLSAKTIEALGATPVAMPQSETSEALAKGVVKGNLSPIEVLKGWNQAESTKYLTKTPFLYNTLFFVTMNLDKWNSLPPDIQKAIEDVNQKYFEEVAIGLWDMQDEEALKYAVDEMGMTVINLPQSEADRWISKVEPIKAEFIAAMNEKGFNGQEIMDTVERLAEKYNNIYK